ncbi:ABC transporter substrate-binding protein [Pelagibius sp. CAU 1746]|uniref:ABC transporter substrate-binding protein n=1 Tax=Pelagibius sp. CAU 1746 TaxID=3140370 RepID=UPI00325A86EE
MSTKIKNHAIGRGLLAATLLATFSAGMAQAEEIRVLNWKGYGTDESWATEAFEAKTGYAVVHDYFNSEQEMLTKLRTNPGTYDVVMINAAFTSQALEEGLIQPIDRDKIANAADLTPEMAQSELLNSGGKTYGVPWVWGLTSLAINDKAFDQMPDSIEVMWDPAHKGKVVLRDDALEAVQFGAIATGQDINDIKDLDAVKEKLASLMPQIRTFWSSENDWNQMVAAGQIDVGTYWSGAASRAKVNFNLPVSFVIPKEGAVGWLDGLSIPAGSKNVDAALAFIDYMISPEFYVEWVNKVGAPVSANRKAVAGLDESAFNRAVLGDPAVAERVVFQKPVSDENREMYLQLWQELKAANQ